MKFHAFLLFAFGGTSLLGGLGSIFAAPVAAAVVPRPWHCIRLPGANESIPVAYLGEDSACYSSNSGLDCHWWVFEPGNAG